MKNTVEFIVTSCSLIELDRFKNSRDHSEPKGERLEVSLQFEFESSGDTTKLTNLLLQETIRAKAMDGLKDLVFQAPVKKEFTEVEVLGFLSWYDYRSNRNLYPNRKDAVKFWKSKNIINIEDENS